MNSNDPNYSPLRDVAQSPEATARYLADVQRVLLDIGSNLETLALETRVHLRKTHVEGDRFYHARLRAMPVEQALASVLNSLEKLTKNMEKTAYKRHAHDEKAANTARERKEKQLEKQRKKNPRSLQAAPGSHQQAGHQPVSGYGGPTSVFDLRGRGNRESA
ncbi:hypothetical protein ABT160_24350 [Streptomyces sp. NPDC001941]|uniref:hypothetical protein n=1 Tax=Streptomyces sp. NPDC001941 TaxID=3154659 RepID=UPI00333294FA